MATRLLKSNLYSIRSTTAAQRKVKPQTERLRTMRDIPCRPRARKNAKSSESPNRSTPTAPKNLAAASTPWAMAGWTAPPQKKPAMRAAR